MLKYRTINVNNDRDILLELHCRINYESETPYPRKVSHEQYSEKWLSTSQPESYLKHLASAHADVVDAFGLGIDEQKKFVICDNVEFKFPITHAHKHCAL